MIVKQKEEKLIPLKDVKPGSVVRVNNILMFTSDYVKGDGLTLLLTVENGSVLFFSKDVLVRLIEAEVVVDA